MSIFRKRQPEITYLECHGHNGWVYCVTGSASRYSVALLKGTQRFAAAACSDLSEAQEMALWLLDNGAVPDDLRETAQFREQPCI